MKYMRKVEDQVNNYIPFTLTEMRRICYWAFQHLKTLTKCGKAVEDTTYFKFKLISVLHLTAYEATWKLSIFLSKCWEHFFLFYASTEIILKWVNITNLSESIREIILVIPDGRVKTILHGSDYGPFTRPRKICLQGPRACILLGAEVCVISPCFDNTTIRRLIFETM